MYFIKPAPFVNEALASVVEQCTDEVELVVVAGLDPREDTGIVPEIRSRIDRLIVEPDGGAGEAANKAWRATQGRWVQFCMADDWFPAQSVEQTLRVLRREPDSALLSGGMSFVEADGAGGMRTLRTVPAQDLTLDRVLDDVCSPAVVFRRDLLDAMDGFDTRFKYAHDRDFMLRAWQRRTPHGRLSHDTYRMRVHELSRTTSGDRPVKLAYWRDHVGFVDEMLSAAELSAEDRRKLTRWRDEAWIKFQILRQITTPRAPALAARIELGRAAVSLARLVGRKALRRHRL